MLDMVGASMSLLVEHRAVKWDSADIPDIVEDLNKLAREHKCYSTAVRSHEAFRYAGDGFCRVELDFVYDTTHAAC
jgi:hypothetical protein